MFGQSLLSAFGIACTTDTDQLFTTDQSATSISTYQLNNATTSIPNNTYPGTASNITYTTGKFGDAAVFNGSNSLITIANNAVFNFTTPTSMSVWVNRNTTNREFIIDKGNGSSGSYGWQFEFNVSEYVFQLNNTVGGIMDLRAAASGTGSWEHIVVTYDSNQVGKIYLNGVLKATDTMAGTASFNTNGVTIGTYSLAPSGYRFDGKLDQIRFFNTALPQSAITALYNETATTATSASIDYQAANPNSTAYYKMVDATDQLGNYNGTATNVNFNTEGKFGFAGAFNGSSSLITIPSGLNKNNNFSWSFWINFNALTLYSSTIVLQDTYRNLIDLDGAPGGSSGAGSLHFYDGVSLSSPAGTVTTGTWYHVVITKSSSTGRKMYVNNAVVASDSSTTNSISGGGQNMIGAYNSGSSTALYLNGKIDQIRIYDSAISAADVSTLYKEVECEPAAINALENFNTVLYTGNGASSRSITGVGFAPDFTWTKKRGPSTANHLLQNTVQGAGTGSALYSASNGSAGSIDQYGYISAFGTDGVTYQAGSSGSYPSDLNNENNSTYVAWNFKAGGTPTATNSAGAGNSPTSGSVMIDGSSSSAALAGNVEAKKMSVNTAAQFSIVEFTSVSGATNQIPHGLSDTPDLFIFKRTDAAQDWYVYTEVIDGSLDYLVLNSTDAKSDSSETAPTATTVYQPTSTGARDYILYSFKSVDGYQKIGSYTGTGGSISPIYVGFEPRFVMIKSTGSTSGNWAMLDNKRGGTSRNQLSANDSHAEYANQGVTFTSTGFSPRQSLSSDTNTSGVTFIYLAIA